MKNSQRKMSPSSVEKLWAVSDSLPFESQQAWTSGSHYMASYMQEHANNGTGLSSKNAALMAAGRLEWLLQETRPSLSGLFSEQDVLVLLDCYLGDMFFPNQACWHASDLCNHLGIEVDDYRASGIAPLIDKLEALSAIQRMTLSDALEQTWHRGMRKQQRQPKDFMASMGINLK